MGHDVGGVVEAPPEGPHHVAVGLAVGVGRAVVSVRGADPGQIGGRLEARTRQLDRLQRYGLLDILGAESQVRADALRRPRDLGGRRLLVLVAPAPVLAPALRGLYQ
jgi:hypothetical protein